MVLIPVPKDRLDEYREISELSAKVWMDHGALEYVENISEDIQDGEIHPSQWPSKKRG